MNNQYHIRVYDQLVGAVATSVYAANDMILFELADGRYFKMYHEQDCCESVLIEDIVGDLNDLVGHPLIEAEEVSFRLGANIADATVAELMYGHRRQDAESLTWTFYKLGTIKGHVNIRWAGESNGYYSESVDFKEVSRNNYHESLSDMQA